MTNWVEPRNAVRRDRDDAVLWVDLERAVLKQDVLKQDVLKQDVLKQDVLKQDVNDFARRAIAGSSSGAAQWRGHRGAA